MLRLICQSCANNTVIAATRESLEENAASILADIQSFTNIKDPESTCPSTESVDNSLNDQWNNESSDDCNNDQAAMFDEKKNWNGPEERRDADTSEWLEDSFIEGGIQTFISFENDSFRSSNRMEDYLQFSNHSNAEPLDALMKGAPRSSTPTKFTPFENLNQHEIRKFNISKIFSPPKLRQFMYGKSSAKRGLEMTPDLSRMEYSQCIVVDEQKKEQDEDGDDDSVDLAYFVNTTKDRIRRRLMNGSYV